MKYLESYFSASLRALLWTIWQPMAFTSSRLSNVSAWHKTGEPTPPPITLYSCLKETRRGLPYLKELLKLSIRSHAHYRATRQWIPYWNSTPLLAELARETPRVLQKIYRPYLSNHFGCRERLDLLMGHYTFIVKHGLGPIVLRASRAPVTLCTFYGKSGSPYQIEIATVGTLDREGELVLRLVSEGNLLYSVAFTFSAHNGPPSVAIGCLQGPRGADSLERIRKATRDLFGLRPKNLLVQLVHQIAHRFGCRDMIMVSNRNLVGRCHIRKGKVFADYDATWEEIGALRHPDGNFTLSCATLPVHDLDAIASKKRSEARKRFALMELTAQLTCEGLRCPPSREGRIAQANGL